MNVALMGSVSSSYHALDALIHSNVEITCVLGVDESRADSISDYHSLGKLTATAQLPYLSFEDVHEPAVEQFLRDHQPDLLWVIGLSQLVPQRLISIARHGGVGFHPTLLPRGRGRAPVAWTILTGQPAAVSLFFLSDEPDAGDLILQREVPVLPDDYSEDLIARTNNVLREAITELAPHIRKGNLPRSPQDHSKATCYSKRTPADGLINWHATTDEIYRLVRAAGRPYPGAFSYAHDEKIVIWRARPASAETMSQSKPEAKPGTIVSVDHKGHPCVRTSDAGLWLTDVAMEDNQQRLPADILTVELCLSSKRA